jgi:hypothetical protein
VDDDFRIFMALQFEVGISDYTAQRESLEKESWDVVDAFRAAGLYALISSYPKWTNVDEMGDFGMFVPVFPVNEINCLCVQVQPSPLRESFTSPSPFAQSTPECRRIVAANVGTQMPEDRFSKVPTDARWNICVEDFRNADFTKSMKTILAIKTFKGGILLLSTGGMPSQFLKGEFEAKLFSFWVNLLGPQPRDLAFLF